MVMRWKYICKCCCSTGSLPLIQWCGQNHLSTQPATHSDSAGQPSTFCGVVKWLSVFMHSSNNKWRWWMPSGRLASQVVWLEPSTLRPTVVRLCHDDSAINNVRTVLSLLPALPLSERRRYCGARRLCVYLCMRPAATARRNAALVSAAKVMHCIQCSIVIIIIIIITLQLISTQVHHSNCQHQQITIKSRYIFNKISATL